MAKKSFIEYLLEPGSDEAELYAAIRAIVGASAFDRFKGVWVAEPYEASDLVRYQTGLWVATADVLATDVPTVSPLWVLLIDLAEFVDGVNFDVAVANIAGRAAYDNAAPPFTVAVSDSTGAGDGRSALYRRIGAAGNWSAPLYIEGLQGIQGDTGDTGQGVPAGGDAGMLLAKQSNDDFDTEWIDPPSTTTTRGTLSAALSKSIPRSVYEFGAAGDGVTEDAFIFGTIDGDASAPEYLLTAGVFLIGVTTSMNKPVRFMPGARIKVPNGVTLTINAEIMAPQSQIFELVGTGKVVLSARKNCVGYAEWWGAVADGVTDCLAAINAAIVNCPIIQLLYGTYRTTGTVLMQTAHRTLRGVGEAWTSGNVGTIIAIDSASADGILHGLGANPGSINAHLQHANIEDLTVNRIPQIDSAASARGVVSQWLLFAKVRNVEAIQHKTGFFGSGCVQIHYDKTYAFRHSVGTNPAVDSFYGYFLNGGSGLAAAGGNASVYYDDCTAACALNAAQCPTNCGYGFAGPAADTFLRRGEVTSCIQGIVVAGGGTQPGDADIHIQDCVCDAIQSQGIVFSGLGEYAAVKHTGNYYAPVGGATFQGIVVSSCVGMISSHGNQVVGWPGVTTGMSIGSSVGLHSEGDMLLDCAKPVEMVASALCHLAPIITNTSVSCGGGGIDCSGSTNRSYFAPIIKGGTNRLAHGVRFDASVSVCEVNATKISPVSASNTVTIHGISYAAPGMYSGNLYSGL